MKRHNLFCEIRAFMDFVRQGQSFYKAILLYKGITRVDDAVHCI